MKEPPLYGVAPFVIFHPSFPVMSCGRRRGAGSMRVSAGSHGVGKALDGELAQLVRRAVLTSAQTDAVIPVGHAPSLAARVRRNPNSAVTPPPPDATFPSIPFFIPQPPSCIVTPFFNHPPPDVTLTLQNQAHTQRFCRASGRIGVLLPVFEKGLKHMKWANIQLKAYPCAPEFEKTRRVDLRRRCPWLLAQVGRVVGAGVEKGLRLAPLERVDARFAVQVPPEKPHLRPKRCGLAP